MMVHPVNWQFGWASILAGFVSGAAIGLFFHRTDFLGGYSSFPRRLVRLGHIALVALGFLNVLFAVSCPESALTNGASVLLMIGGAAMPLVCFLTAWKSFFRSLFFIPVLSLSAAVVLILSGGAS